MLEKDLKQLIIAVRFPIVLVLILWVVHFYNVYTSGSLGVYGVYPRAIDGIRGIFLAPFIHNSRDSFQHLISNTVPLFMLTSMIALFYNKVLYPAFVIIFLLTGFAVWMFGRPLYHIGASGVVYGLLSFVFWSGVFRRNIKSIILALIVTMLFNGFFLGLFPNKDGVSWESHLFGAVAGLFTAFLFKSVLEKDEEDEAPWSDTTEEEFQFFLPRNTFEMTKQERAIWIEQERLRKEEENGDWTITIT